jgi:hypothetical protein
VLLLLCYANERVEPVAVLLLLWGAMGTGVDAGGRQGRRKVQRVSARVLWGNSERATGRTQRERSWSTSA